MGNGNNSVGEHHLERELGVKRKEDLISALKQLIVEVEQAEEVYMATVELNNSVDESLDKGWLTRKKGERVSFSVFAELKRRA